MKNNLTNKIQDLYRYHLQGRFTFWLELYKYSKLKKSEDLWVARKEEE